MPSIEANSQKLPAPEMPILAVLPFNNLSTDVDEYFADGLTEDIITNLSRFGELLVVARTSTFKFKGQPLDLAELSTELNAGEVIEGSVRRAGGRVRITARTLLIGRLKWRSTRRGLIRKMPMPIADSPWCIFFAAKMICLRLKRRGRWR